MDDVRLLKGFLIVLGLAVAAAVSLFAPGPILIAAVVTIITGINLRISGTHESERARANTYLLVGSLLLVPPVIWFSIALAR